MAAHTRARRGLTGAIVLAVALGATSACTDDDAHPQGDAATALSVAVAALPAALVEVAPAEDVLAVFEGTASDGRTVRGLVARDDETCTAATADRDIVTSVLASPADEGAHDGEDGGEPDPAADLLASTLQTSGYVAADSVDDSTTSVVLRCGPEGAEVVLDPMPADLQVVGSATVIRYANGFPVGLVVGPDRLRERAADVAATADSPDPAVLDVPRLAVDDTTAGTLTPSLRRHVVATFTIDSPTGALTGAVALTGTQCALTADTGPGPFGLGATADLALTADERAAALIEQLTATVLAASGVGGDIALTCTSSGAAVRISGAEPGATRAEGAVSVTAGEDGGTLLLVGTAEARRSVTSLLARR
ncbi:hypothetical protein ACTHAM_000451 [Cellulomonas soli]|uniref:hypothetical protein n=1 Tax=Cellulomonas soli TaxID=931535 RepID=UPI003F84D85E